MATSSTQQPLKYATLPHRSLRAFVWDLADEGPEEVIENLARLGVDGLHMGMVCHGGRFYCPHNPHHGIVHAPEGAIYFQPLLSCYEEIRPRLHPEYGSGAFVARVRNLVHQAGMNLTAWTVLFNNLALSQHHPEYTCVNALGDRLEGALCPSFEAVRLYALALAEDLAHRVGVDVIELEDFSFPAPCSYSGSVWRQVPIGPALGYLMCLCFCEGCRKHAEEANIEVEDLRHRVERIIRSGLEGDLSERRINDEISDPYHPVSRYAQARASSVTTLLDDLLEAIEGSSAHLQLILRDDPDDLWRWGIEPHVLRQRQIRATIDPRQPMPAAGAMIERFAEILQLGQDLAVELPLEENHQEEGQSLREAIELCERLGLERFVFSHYGLVRHDLLDPIQMLARRS